MTRRRPHTLEGDLESFPPPLLFQMMALGQQDGVLCLDGPQAGTCQVHFRRGRVAWANGPGPSPDLGDELVQRGFLDRQVLVEVAGERRRSGGERSLAGILVERGALRRADLEICLRARIEVVVCAVLEWRKGRFHFDAARHHENDDLRLDIELEPLLLECMTRLDDARHAGGEPGERHA